MCAGITVFAPLDELAVEPGTRVGVIGIGGLGHLALQFAKALNCEVTALSGTAAKSDEATLLGADHFALTSEAGTLEKLISSFDVLLATAEGDLPWNSYVALLRPGGTLWLLGMPHQPLVIDSAPLMLGRRSISGSIIVEEERDVVPSWPSSQRGRTPIRPPAVKRRSRPAAGAGAPS